MLKEIQWRPRQHLSQQTTLYVSFIGLSMYILLGTVIVQPVFASHDNSSPKSFVFPLPPMITTRIVGGDPVGADHAYPFYAFPAGNYNCGGTLIHSDIILTAAHCEMGFTQAGVLVGGHTIDGRYSRYYGVEEVLVHPDYSTATYVHDIMVLRIDGDAPGPYVQLNDDENKPADGVTLSVIGYGNTAEDGTYSPDLLTVDFFSVDYEQCADYFGPIIVDEYMTCTGGIEAGGQDSCHGDSGGPVFLHGTQVQVGIVSFGDGCGKPDVPSVNVRVSSYLDWIEDAVCSLSKSPPPSCFKLQSQEINNASEGMHDPPSDHSKNNTKNDKAKKKDVIKVPGTNIDVTITSSTPTTSPTRLDDSIDQAEQTHIFLQAPGVQGTEQSVENSSTPNNDSERTNRFQKIKKVLNENNPSEGTDATKEKKKQSNRMNRQTLERMKVIQPNYLRTSIERR